MLCCLLITDELAEILADGPISHAKKSNMTEKVAVANNAKGEVDDEDAGGVLLELNDWV